MPAAFWGAYLVKLLVLGATLAGLYALAHRLKGALGRGAHRYLEVVESAALSPQAAVHLLRVGTRYLLIGGGNAGVCKLAEFSAAELTTPQNT